MIKWQERNLKEKDKLKLPFGFKIKVREYHYMYLYKRCTLLTWVDVNYTSFKREPLKYWAYMLIKSYNARRHNKKPVIIPVGYLYI